ncbi:MAG: hypothetical protein U1F55_14945, partial [Chitinivorax sp.]
MKETDTQRSVELCEPTSEACAPIAKLTWYWVMGAVWTILKWSIFIPRNLTILHPITHWIGKTSLQCVQEATQNTSLQVAALHRQIIHVM